MDKYIKIAIDEALISEEKGDIPVGAVIVKNDQIISKAHNEKETTSCATKHAEIIAIEEACKKLKNWHLDDCILYTTMEPCMMCCGAIIQSRIKKVIYIVKNSKYGFSSYIDKKYKITFIKIDDEDEILKILRKFFEEKR